MSPTVGKRVFQYATIIAPSAVMLLLEVERQLGQPEWDYRTLWRVGIGALVSLVVVVFNVQRSATVTAESAAEVRTDRDQDDDKLVEQPE